MKSFQIYFLPVYIFTIYLGILNCLDPMLPTPNPFEIIISLYVIIASDKHSPHGQLCPLAQLQQLNRHI